MPVINMRSAANMIKGQGVSSCYNEQVRLVTSLLSHEYKFYINSSKTSDIVHYHTVNLGYYIERTFNKRKTAGIGYVHFLPDTVDNSLDMPILFRKVFYKYLLAFYNSMDYLVVVNPCVIDKLRHYGIAKPKIIYIPNYVSEEQFYPMGNQSELRKQYCVSENTFVVLGVGQLQKRKGVIDFIEVAKRMPHIEFVWAGGFSFGPITDGYKEIKSIVGNPPANVKFLGIVPREKMNAIYNMADVLFLPSFDELFPMTILEAYCCKKPVLLRDIDIYPQILFDSYLKASSVDEFVNTLDNLRVSDLSYWQDKVWQCHSIYSEQNISKMWHELYREAYKGVRKA